MQAMSSSAVRAIAFHALATGLAKFTLFAHHASMRVPMLKLLREIGDG
jgi:hypothetical protein